MHDLNMNNNCDAQSSLHVDPDPRVQVELENLNTSTEFINKLELELEKARQEFNKLIQESSLKIEKLSKKLDSSIQKARPYYEARARAQELHQQAQKEALKYEQATAEHNNAKEIVQLAEETLKKNGDTELEELLTKSAEKVNQAELERSALEKQHQITSREYSLTEQKLFKLHNQLKRSIVKASMETRRNLLDLNNYSNQHRLQLLPYFEMKAQFNQMLDEQVNKIRSYEARVNKAKRNYTKALERLEDLNQKIFEDRFVTVEIDKETDAQLNELEDRSSSPVPDRIHDDTIYDHPTLDQLVLEDHLDENISHLKEECSLSSKSISPLPSSFVEK